MKTIIKLLVAAAVINACARVGVAAWGYYQLQDAVHEIALFGGESTSDMQTAIVAKAMDLNVPLDAAHVDVQRDGRHTMVQARYTKDVELFPGYTYAVPFSIDEDVLSANPVTGPDSNAR
jgi:hypothetical protein